MVRKPLNDQFLKGKTSVVRIWTSLKENHSQLICKLSVFLFLSFLLMVTFVLLCFIPWGKKNKKYIVPPKNRLPNLKSFPGGSDIVKSACRVRDLGSIFRSGRFSGEGNGNPLQYSFLENPMDRGAWWANSPWGHKESDTIAWWTLSLPFPLLWTWDWTCWLNKVEFWLYTCLVLVAPETYLFCQ